MSIQNSADQFFTGTGILVQGDPFRANTTGYDNKPLKDGRVEYYCAVAFPKDQPAATQFDQMWATMQQVAQGHKYAANYIQGQWQGFHWKMEDGDAPANINKPGWKGCWVIKFKNGFQPQVFDENRQAVPSPYIDGVDANGVMTQQSKGGAHPFPCGHFVRVMCSFKNNDSAPPQSGLYINFHMIQRVGYGTVIQSGPDYSQVMGAQAAALPGMSAMPVGGAAPIMSPQPGMPGQPAGMPGQPAGMPGAATPPGGAAMPGGAAGLPGTPPGAGMPPAGGAAGMPPAVGGLPQAGGGMGMPPAPGGLPATPPPAQPPVETPQQRMIDQQYTYDQYIQAGYTEAGMIAQGLMRPAAAPGGAAMPGTPGGLPPAGHTYNQ